MRISLATLSKRQDDVLDALKNNRKISVSHNGLVVAVLQSPEIVVKRARMPVTPAFGMWADREDMADPNEWRRDLRKKRRRSLLNRVALTAGRR